MVPVSLEAMTAGPCSLKGGGQHQRSSLKPITAEVFHLHFSIICTQKHLGTHRKEKCEEQPHSHAPPVELLYGSS